LKSFEVIRIFGKAVHVGFWRGEAELNKFLGQVEVLDSAVEGTAEKQNVGLRSVEHVVDPTRTLLHSQVAPLGLGHQMSVGHLVGNVLGQLHVPILKVIVCVLLRVPNVIHWHCLRT